MTFSKEQLDELAAIDAEGGHENGHPGIRSEAPKEEERLSVDHRVRLIARFRNGDQYEAKIPKGQPYKGPDSVEWTKIEVTP